MMMKHKSISSVKVAEKGRYKGRSEKRSNTQGREEEVGEEAEEEGGWRRSRRRRKDDGEVEKTNSCQMEEFTAVWNTDGNAEYQNNYHEESMGRIDGRQPGVRLVPRPVPLTSPPVPPPSAPQRYPQRQGVVAGEVPAPPTARLARRRTTDRYRTFVILGEGRQSSPCLDKLPLTSESPLTSSFSSSSSFISKPELQRRFSTFLPPSSSTSTFASKGIRSPEIVQCNAVSEGDALMSDYRSSRAPGGSFSTNSFFKPLGEVQSPIRPIWKHALERGVKLNIERTDARLGSAGSSVSSSSSNNNKNGFNFPLASSSKAWHISRDSSLGGHKVLRNPVFLEGPESGSEITIHGTDVSKELNQDVASCLTPVEALAEVHQPVPGRQQCGLCSDSAEGLTTHHSSIHTGLTVQESLKARECAGRDTGLLPMSSFMSLPPLQSSLHQPLQPPSSLLASSSNMLQRLMKDVLTSPASGGQNSPRSLCGEKQRRSSRIPLPWPPLLPGSGLLQRGNARKSKASPGPRNNFEALVLEGLEEQSDSDNWILRQDPVTRTPSLPARPHLPDGVSKKSKRKERMFGYETITKVKNSFESFLMNQHSRTPQTSDRDAAPKKRIVPRLSSRKDSAKGSKNSEQTLVKVMSMKDSSRPYQPSAALQTPWLPRRREDKSVSEAPPLVWPPKDLNYAISDTPTLHIPDHQHVSWTPESRQFLQRVNDVRGREEAMVQPLQLENKQPFTFEQGIAAQLTGPDAERSHWGLYTTQRYARGVSEGVTSCPYEALRGSHYILEAAVQLPSRKATEAHPRSARVNGTQGSTSWNSHARGKRKKKVLGGRKYNTVSKLSDIRPRKGILKKTLSGGSLPSNLHRRRIPRKAMVTYRLPSAHRPSPSPQPSPTPRPSSAPCSSLSRPEVDAGYECDTELSVGDGEQSSNPTPMHCTSSASTHNLDNAPKPAPATPKMKTKMSTPPLLPPSRPQQTTVVST